MDKFLIAVTIVLLVSIISCTSPDPSLDVLFETPDFTLQSSSGEDLSREDLLDHIWLVDFIFTRCGGPCPLMTQQMLHLQNKLIEEGLVSPPYSVRLVSITVDPAYDTPEILREYANNWKADLNSWYFLTGPPESTLSLIREGFKVTAEREGSGTEHGGMDMPDIIHSTNFLLVDRQGRVRKIYRLDEPDFTDQVIGGIRTLGPNGDV